MNHSSLIVKPGSKFSLSEIDPEGQTNVSKDAAKYRLSKLQEKLSGLQSRLYAQGKQSLLVVMQAMDAGGKDGTIKTVFRDMNPQGMAVTSFKVPSTEELAHDFLWRVHAKAPARGMIGIFNRSHYEDVLIVRVNELVPESVWRSRYDQINAFEKLLSDNGTRIVKFFLHISKDEQKARLEDRLKSPDEQWKFSMGDLPVRLKWGDYMDAYDDALSNCSTDNAPWYVIPSNRKWLRNLLVTQILVETLEDMDPQYPAPEPGLESVVIPD
ncbi:MAG: polyphosphate kinase 2 family protein [Chloroflexi bacterium]|nr:polyphosphate kinase 2 family protein [Chloroflexota bacterium]